jgi:hypothetical protein
MSNQYLVAAAVDITEQKTVFFIVTAVKTSNLITVGMLKYYCTASSCCNVHAWLLVYLLCLRIIYYIYRQ